MKQAVFLSPFQKTALALAVSLNVAAAAHAVEALDTVIVTAGKIEQDVQQTAVSIQSLSDEKLSAAGISSLADVAKFTPGLQLDQSGGGLTATIRVRGIGTPGNSPLDPSAPIFIDGVAQGRSGSGFQDLIDVARVEVLRGPQGTLYGRNSTAGAINVWTKDASTRQWEGSVQGQLGNYNDREFKGTVNVPMVENVLGGRFSVFSVKQDGYIDNVTTGDTGNGYADRQGGRAKILLNPLDDVSVQWITDYSKSINHPLSTVVSYPSTVTAYANLPGAIASNPYTGPDAQANGLAKINPYSDRAYVDGPNWTKDVNFATSVTVTWDITQGFLANHTFTSLTSYQRYMAKQDLDNDSTALLWRRTSGTTHNDSWSQELRISSDAGEKFEYVGGLFYYGELVNSDQRSDNIFADSTAALDAGVFGTTVNPRDPVRLSNSLSHTNLRQDNAAVFGQVTYNFTDKLSLTAGLRQSYVKKQGNSTVDPTLRIINVPANLAQSSTVLINDITQTEHDTSGVLKARYFLDDGIMLYASFDRGFKPGGFNRIIRDNPNFTSPRTFKKENSNNFEIGAKTQWFENRLQANISAFYLDFINYHSQSTDPQTTNLIIENVKSVVSEGIELDVQALLGEGFTTGLSATYLNPRVKDDGIPHNESTTRTDRSATLKNGELINDVSQYSANVFAEYAYPLSQGPAEAFVRGDLGYKSRFLLSGLGLDNAGGSIYQGGYSTSNLRFGVRKLAENWTLTGWVKNLTDKQYATSGSYGIANQIDGSSITIGAPRTFGATVQYDY